MSGRRSLFIHPSVVPPSNLPFHSPFLVFLSLRLSLDLSKQRNGKKMMGFEDSHFIQDLISSVDQPTHDSSLPSIPTSSSINGSDPPPMNSSTNTPPTPPPPPPPPSYSDVISTQQPTNPNRSDTFRDLDFDITDIAVSDPRTEAERSPNSLVPSTNTYVTYLITTGTHLSRFSVRRRFRDVVTLADRLAESCRGYFVPSRPDKSFVEGQMMHREEFVNQRRVALERYLRRLAAHPVIRGSEELRVFLQVQGKLPPLVTTDVTSRTLDAAVKLPRQLFGEPAQEVVQPAKGGRDLLQIFKELKQAVVNDWGSVRPLVVEEDREFLDRKDKLQDFEHHLSNSSQQAEALVKSQQDIGETMGALGLAFVKLTKFETEQALHNSQRIRAGDYRCLATATVKVTRLYRELNAKTVKHLDTLHEYLGLMLAAWSAFSDRSSALLTVQTFSTELSSLQSRAEKLEAAASKIFGGDRSRIQKVEELKETIRATGDVKHCADREYERIKENNRFELERLDRERPIDFYNMLKGFITSQVGYAEKMANTWTRVMEETSKYAEGSQ